MSEVGEELEARLKRLGGQGSKKQPELGESMKKGAMEGEEDESRPDGERPGRRD